MAQEEIVFVSRFDDSQLDAAFKRFTGSIDKAQDAVGDLGGKVDKVMKEAAKETDAYNQELIKTAKTSDTLTNVTKQTDAALTQTNKRLVSLRSILKDIVLSGGDVRGSLQRAREEMDLNGQSAGSLFKGLFSLKGIATGLAGALVAVTGVALAVYFTKSKAAAQQFSETMGSLREQASVVGGRLLEFGESLVKVFQGTARQGEVLDNLVRIFSGYNDELDKAAEKGRELARVQGFLNEFQANFLVVEGNAIAKINEYRAAVDDSTKSISGRIGALRQAGKTEADLERARIFAAEQELARVKAKSLNLEGEVSDVLAVGKAERRVIDLRNAAAERERQDAATLRQIREERSKKLDEERKKVEALNKAYRSLLERLAQRVEKAQISELLGTDKVQAEKEAALKEVDAFVNEIAAAATAAGRSLPEGFASDVQDLVSAVETEFRGAVDKLREKDKENGVFAQLLLPKDKSGLEDAAQSAFNRLNGVFNENQPLLQRIKDGIAGAFGLSREELENGFQEISAGFNLAFSNFVQGIDAATEAQISAQDRIIERRREQVDELKELLDIELQRERDGFANSVGVRERELAEKQALLEAAEKKRAALEEKAARRTLIINSVQQASEATLTIARLLSASAKLGIFGFIAAAAVGVSTVFSILAQAKAQSAKFAQAPGFREGTPFLYGAGTGKSDSIPAYLSRGERVMPAHLNEVLGGAKMPNDLLVKYALSGMDRERETAEDVRRRQANIDGHKYARDAFAGLTRDDMAGLMKSVIDEIGAIPKHYYGPDGSKVVERKKGGKVIRQTVKSK